jgi:hypothetical protein
MVVEEFEDAWLWNAGGTQDRALRRIFWHGAWHLYDDFRTERLTGEWKRDKTGRREVARWILFLQSGREYEWPTLGAEAAFKRFLTRLTCGRLVFPGSRLADFGDIDVWPFVRVEDFDEARRHPEYLAGRRAV